MKKREFLAMSGALPLMVAGCGDSGSGTAQMRLVNASIGYANLGLMVETTQATNADVAYGAASPFAGVPAGSVTTTLTTTTAGVVTDLLSTTRTLSSGARYSLVGYGYSTAPKSVVVVENQPAPDAGNAAFNVLNTSIDVGAVDVYLSPTTTITTAPIATSVGGVSQSVFSQITPGTYVLTVVRTGTGATPTPDIRLQVIGVTLADQQIATLILSPGASGVLANGILLTQGETGTAQALLNTQSRVLAVAATGISGIVAVDGVLEPVLSPATSNRYVKLTAGAAPRVTVDGVALTSAGTMAAGTDYTLLVYRDPSTTLPKSVLIRDDNRLPLTVTGCKVRLLNAVYDADLVNTLPLTLQVNGATVASNTLAAQASDFVEVAALASSLVSLKSNFVSILEDETITLSPGSIYTELVVGEGSPLDTTHISKNFVSARV